MISNQYRRLIFRNCKFHFSYHPWKQIPVHPSTRGITLRPITDGSGGGIPIVKIVAVPRILIRKRRPGRARPVNE